MVFVEAIDENLHLLAVHCDWRRRHEHAVLAVEVQRLLGRRLHADDRDIIAVTHLADSHRRRRITGDDNCLDIAADEKVERLLNKAHDLLPRLDTIWHIVLIRVKDELLIWQYAHRVMQHRKPANA